MVDVTIVCTVRFPVLARTLQSLVEYAKPHRFRAVFNLDPVPDTGESMDALIEKAHSLVSSFMPVAWAGYPADGVPSFAKAVKRVWENTTADYVLHLEDDWEFIRKIDMDECVRLIDSGDADYIRFGKRNRAIQEEVTKPALLPSMWRGDVVRTLAKYMRPEYDPEKQLHDKKMFPKVWAHLPQKVYEYAGGKQCVRDTGREWRDARGLGKWDKNKPGDITWE